MSLCCVIQGFAETVIICRYIYANTLTHTYRCGHTHTRKGILAHIDTPTYTCIHTHRHMYDSNTHTYGHLCFTVELFPVSDSFKPNSFIFSISLSHTLSLSLIQISFVLSKHLALSLSFSTSFIPFSLLLHLLLLKSILSLSLFLTPFLSCCHCHTASPVPPSPPPIIHPSIHQFSPKVTPSTQLGLVLLWDSQHGLSIRFLQLASPNNETGKGTELWRGL